MKSFILQLVNPSITDRDPLLQWRCNSFYRTVLICLLVFTLPFLFLCAQMQYYRMMALMIVSNLVQIGVLYIVYKKKLTLAFSLFMCVNMTTLSVSLYLQGKNDVAYLFPFLVLLPGIFGTIHSIIAWELVVATIILTVAGIHPSMSLLPRTFTGETLGSLFYSEADHLSSALVYTLIAALLSFLLYSFIKDLFLNISCHNELLEKEVLRRREVQATVVQINEQLEHRVQTRTEQLRNSERKLHQSEKLRALGQLAGGIAHDFNNHLSGIMASAQVIKGLNIDNKDLDEITDLIITSTKSTAGLTKQLLTFARKRKMQMETIHLHEMIMDVVSLLKRTIDKKITIQTRLQADTFFIKGDFSLLHNALINLGLNARDAMAEGGSLTFETENVSFSPTDIKKIGDDMNPGGYVVISVKDTGRGIPEVLLTKIFEPFFSTKKGGNNSGMGLSAVYGTVKSHRGAVKVKSTFGAGTQFDLYFPIVHKDATKQDPVPAPADVKNFVQNTDALSVVIVDDENIVRESMRRLLEKEQMSIHTFSNGKDALEFIKIAQDAVHCVILDMIMPQMDGVTVLEKLRQFNSSVPVIFCSGYCEDPRLLYQIEKEKIPLLKKPYAAQNLVAAVRSVVCTTPC